MDNDNASLLPVDSGTYGSEVFSLAQIVKRKINSVVDVTEIRFLPLFSLNLFEFDAKVVLLRVILN